MRSIVLLLFAVCLAPVLGAQWPMHRGGPSLPGVAAGSLPDKPVLAWSFVTGGAILSSPAIVDGVVYFGSSDQAVYALSFADGKKLWSFATDDMIEAPPLVHEGRVFIGSSDFFLYALDAKTGELAWKFETEDKILGGANWWRDADGHDRIVFGSYDTRLYCVDASSGKKLWDYKTDNYVNGTPAILGDRIVFGGCDAVLHVVSAKSGEAVAQIALGDECHVAGSVALAGERVYLGDYGNEFVCVDLQTGERAWAYTNPAHPFFSSPAIGEDRVVFGGRDKKLHCAARADGKPLWTFPTRRKVDGSPVICGDKVVFGSGDGRLYVLRVADGKLVWEYEIGQSIYSSPAVVDGTIVVGANDGRLYAFRGAAGK